MWSGKVKVLVFLFFLLRMGHCWLARVKIQENHWILSTFISWPDHKQTTVTSLTWTLPPCLYKSHPHQEAAAQGKSCHFWRILTEIQMRWFTFREHRSSPTVEQWTAHRLIKALLLLPEAGAGRGRTLIIAQRTARTIVCRSKRWKQAPDHVPGMDTLSNTSHLSIYSQDRCLIVE